MLCVVKEFLEAIRSVQPPGRWKILVVDEFSQKLLSSVLKQFDILEENVTRTYNRVMNDLVYGKNADLGFSY